MGGSNTVDRDTAGPHLSRGRPALQRGPYNPRRPSFQTGSASLKQGMKGSELHHHTPSLMAARTAYQQGCNPWLLTCYPPTTLGRQSDTMRCRVVSVSLALVGANPRSGHLFLTSSTPLHRNCQSTRNVTSTSRLVYSSSIAVNLHRHTKLRGNSSAANSIPT